MKLSRTNLETPAIVSEQASTGKAGEPKLPRGVADLEEEQVVQLHDLGLEDIRAGLLRQGRRLHVYEVMQRR